MNTPIMQQDLLPVSWVCSHLILLSVIELVVNLPQYFLIKVIPFLGLNMLTNSWMLRYLSPSIICGSRMGTHSSVHKYVSLTVLLLKFNTLLFIWRKWIIFGTTAVTAILIFKCGCYLDNGWCITSFSGHRIYCPVRNIDAMS